MSTITELDWQKFFNLGDSVQGLVTTIVTSTSVGITTAVLAPSTLITRIVTSSSGAGSAIAFTTVTLPWVGFQGSVKIIVASSSAAAITTTSSGVNSGDNKIINLGSTLVPFKALELTYDGTGWNPSY